MAELRQLQALMREERMSERAGQVDRLMAALEARHELHCADLHKGLSTAEKAAWKQRMERLQDPRRDQADRQAQMERRTGATTLRTDLEEDSRARKRINAGNMDMKLDTLRRRLDAEHKQFAKRHPHHRNALEKRTAERMSRRAEARTSSDRASRGAHARRGHGAERGHRQSDRRRTGADASRTHRGAASSRSGRTQRSDAGSSRKRLSRDRAQRSDRGQSSGKRR